MPYRPGEDIAAILEKIRNPLVFYALALLSTESLLYLGLIYIDDDNLKFYSVLLMGGLFLVVIGIVGYITLTNPEHLYETIVDRIKPVVISAVQKEAAQIDERSQENTEYISAITIAATALLTEATPLDRKDATKRLLALKPKYPADRKIHIFLGRLYKKAEQYDVAIDVLSDFIRVKEQRGEAVEKDTTDVLYNRACYFCLKSTKVPPEQRDRYKELAYSDLERSIQISHENKIDAAVDKDFESIRNESRFENLIVVSNKVA